MVRHKPTQQKPRPATFEEVEQEANIPYRGYVDHGVEVQGAVYTPSDEDELEPDVGDLVHYDTEPTEPAPQPVYVVPGPGEGGEVVRLFRTIYASPTNASAMIIGRHKERTSLKIVNAGTKTVWIGEGPGVSPVVGFPIAAGADLDLTTNREVWAVLAASDYDPAVVQPVYALEQYSVQV